MNDPSQIEYHKEKPLLLECDINQTEEGYQARCPTCPWTSGVRDLKTSANLSYYRHIDYIGKGLNA